MQMDDRGKKSQWSWKKGWVTIFLIYLFNLAAIILISVLFNPSSYSSAILFGEPFAINNPGIIGMGPAYSFITSFISFAVAILSLYISIKSPRSAARFVPSAILFILPVLAILTMVLSDSYGIMVTYIYVISFLLFYLFLHSVGGLIAAASIKGRGLFAANVFLLVVTILFIVVTAYSIGNCGLSSDSRANCFGSIARDTQTIDACKHISNDGGEFGQQVASYAKRDTCYYNLAEKLERPDLCANVSEKRNARISLKRCYSNMAIKLGRVDLCEKTVSGEKKNLGCIREATISNIKDRLIENRDYFYIKLAECEALPFDEGGSGARASVGSEKSRCFNALNRGLHSAFFDRLRANPHCKVYHVNAREEEMRASQCLSAFFDLSDEGENDEERLKALAGFMTHGAWYDSENNIEQFIEITKRSASKEIESISPIEEPFTVYVNKAAADAILENINTNNKSAREAFAKLLLAIKDDRIEETMIGLLKDPEPQVRKTAIISLGRGGEKRVLPHILAMLKDKDIAYVKSQALLSLKYFIDEKEEVIPHVESMLEESPQLRLTAFALLDYFKNEGSVESLIEALYDRDRLVAGMAMLSLSLYPVTEELLVIALKMYDDPSFITRRGVAKIFLKSKDPRVVKPSIALLGDAHADIAVDAIKALGEIGDGKAVEPLIGVLLGDYDHGRGSKLDEKLKIAAAKSLVKIGDERAIEPLIKALQNKREDFDVRMEAGSALGEFKGAEVIQAFRDIMLDQNEVQDFRRLGAANLIEIGDPLALEALKEALDDETLSIKTKKLIRTAINS